MSLTADRRLRRLHRSQRLRALILAGGSGTRFWPLSRKSRPKQLLALDDERSLLRRTVERLAPIVAPEDVWVCTTRALAEQVREQLPQVPPEQILGEPTGRDTGPAIGWAIREMGDLGVSSTLAVLAADHRIEDEASFRSTLEAAAAAVEDGDRILALGVTPRWAETGYGYLEVGETLDEATGLSAVERFREKPDAETAKRFVESGNYLWNASMFVFRGGRVLDLLREHEPEIASGLDAIAERSASGDGIDDLYAALPSLSIDYAVMERAPGLATLALDCGWSDLGSWEALAEVLDRVGPADEKGNVERGDTFQVGGERNLLFADEGMIATVGVSDLIVVRTGDAVLVARKGHAQEVKAVVEELLRRGADELL